MFVVIFVAKCCVMFTVQGQLQKRSEEVDYMRESLAKLKAALEQEKRLNASIKQKKVGLHSDKLICFIIGICLFFLHVTQNYYNSFRVNS